jgi:hypothetical protein
MTALTVISVCVTVVLSLLGVATIFAGAWVKASRIDEMQKDINKIWEKLNTVAVLESRIEGIEDGIREIKDLLKHR